MTRAFQGLVAGATPAAPPGQPVTAKLNTSDQCTLDGNGNGTCSLGPTGSHVWTDVVIAIEVDAPASGAVTNPKTPQARYYIGPQPFPAYLIDFTTMGNGNSSARGAAYPISAGELVIVQWKGGQPGYIATLSVFGNERTQ